MAITTVERERAKWVGWLCEIKQDVQGLVCAQYTFNETQAMVRENPALRLPSSFYDYLAETYVSHTIVGLRRQIKDGRDCISLARLLREMAESPHFVSRDYYTALYKGTTGEDLANIDFDRHAAPGLGHVDGAKVATDLHALRTTMKKCEEFADRRIAHWDRRGVKTPPTFAELGGCVDFLDRLYVKYHGLFHAQAMDTLLPTWQYDWRAIFRMPWIPPESGTLR